MNPALYLLCFLPLLLILLERRQKTRTFFARKIQSRRKAGRNTRSNAMNEIVKRYIGKDCLIYTMNSQLSGVVKEVVDGWLVVDNGTDEDAVNLDFIIRIRNYPRNKNGKRKSIVTD
ncbi:MAG: hypothetical protein Q4C13_09180 [Clostridia bacterium]|nr:hypothetical protein [Clostridia bacterium]